MPPNQAKFELLAPMTEMLGKIESTEYVKKGVDEIVRFRNAIPAQYGISPVINNFLNNVVQAKQKAGSSSANKAALTEQIDYIKAQIDGTKKGF